MQHPNNYRTQMQHWLACATVGRMRSRGTHAQPWKSGALAPRQPQNPRGL
jgi:hypothetical protein